MTTLVQEILRLRQDKTTRLPQRKQSLTNFNTTVRADPYDECVHEMFETQVEKSPEAIALVCGDKQFTYRELNARANQLAHFLKRFGVGPNSLVGLIVERSPEMIVGILGTLKAGAAYAPIDPTFSSDRLSFILKDANIFVLLTQSHMLEALPRHDGPRLSLDSDWDVIAKERKDDPLTATTTADLAYVIYPSASTGQPKGVMISHRGLVNYLSWGVEAHELAKGFGTRVDSTTSFDLAVTRVLSPLIIGKSVFLPDVWDVREDGFH